MNTMSFLSAQTNRDGEGAFGKSERGTTTIKFDGKIRYDKNYFLLSTHQRLATSGKKDYNNLHPHQTENLILQHNGIFSGIGNEKISDTKVYTKMLEKTYQKLRKDEKIVCPLIDSIKKLHKHITGTYSIVVLEKSTGKLYYYKEDYTSMYGVQDDEWLVLSTSKENAEFAKWFLKINGKVKEPKPMRIYDVLDGMKIVGKIKEKKIRIIYYNKQADYNDDKFYYNKQLSYYNNKAGKYN